MKRGRHLGVLIMAAILGTASLVAAHTVNYEVQQKGVAVRVFYGPEDPAGYSEFEVYGPGDTLPHQTGRTDKNGFVSFFPDRRGAWKVKVLGESTHGFHGVTTEVQVDQDLNLESFKKPLAAAYTKVVTGVSLIIGLFGFYALYRSRKKQQPSKSEK